MTSTVPVKGKRAWIKRKILGNYWSLASTAVVLAAPAALAMLWLDRAGLTEWLLDAGLAPVTSAETARDFAGVAAGINGAFLSLYFSITLIVLSLAAGSISVRLVDRWLDKQLVRLSVAGLSFSLVVSLVTLLATDGFAPLDETPLGLIVLTFVLMLVSIAMLSVSLHDLGRTMFVDRSIASLQRDASSPPVAVVGRAPSDAGTWHVALESTRGGYIAGIDLAKIARCTAGYAGVRVCVAPGQHVLRGETLICMSAPYEGESLADALPIDDFRSDAQGSVFRIRLLVEIAARALSPGINDFYTALTCSDALMVAMEGHRSSWVADGEIACWADDQRIGLAGQDFASLFNHPLAAFRQAACDYPTVAIRMIGNLGKLAGTQSARCADGFTAFLLERARELRDHALLRIELEADRAAIAECFAEFESRCKAAALH
ncbi:MAG: DUF2254 family protein [Erythrobacter sp.]|jgi:uncharacterized membrane protein|nr:DUF2254 family protein [Erythrobacter sp.]